MGFLEQAQAKNYRRMREEAIEPILQKGETIESFGMATWLPESKFLKWMVHEAILQFTVGKFHIVCLTNKRFLLFRMPIKMTKSYSHCELELELPRNAVQGKSLKKKGLISKIITMVLQFNQAEERTLIFKPPYTKEAEVIWKGLSNN